MIDSLFLVFLFDLGFLFLVLNHNRHVLFWNTLLWGLYDFFLFGTTSLQRKLHLYLLEQLGGVPRLFKEAHEKEMATKIRHSHDPSKKKDNDKDDLGNDDDDSVVLVVAVKDQTTDTTTGAVGQGSSRSSSSSAPPPSVLEIL